jgi:uncharacterized membrane protein YcgQ (UPF0703/DUF1980 family)
LARIVRQSDLSDNLEFTIKKICFQLHGTLRIYIFMSYVYFLLCFTTLTVIEHIYTHRVPGPKCVRNVHVN